MVGLVGTAFSIIAVCAVASALGQQRCSKRLPFGRLRTAGRKAYLGEPLS
jgi:hypothetical protein